jgi:hypothetical protein
MLLALTVPCSAFGQKQVEGPRKVSADSIEVKITNVRLEVANSQLEFANSPTPRMYPTGSRESQIWFSLGFMLGSCRVAEFERVHSTKEKQGPTTNNVTFRCHYKASEFRSAISDLMN